MKISTSISIKSPIENVFDTFSDLDSIKNYVDGIQSLEVLEGPAKMQVGTKWRETRVMFGKEATEVMWVTELTPNASYVVEAESHGTHYRSEYRFSTAGEETTVEMTFGGQPLTLMSKILGTLLFPLFAGSTKKALMKDMEDLKRTLETN